MKVSAKVDYAVRAAIELAAREGDGAVKGEELARAQGIPPRFLENILVALRRAELVESRRGPDGGFRLARPADEICVAEVIRAVDGPLASVGGVRPDQLHYNGSAVSLPAMWVAVRAALRDLLETVTLADLAAGRLPIEVQRRVAEPDAWARR